MRRLLLLLALVALALPVRAQPGDPLGIAYRIGASVTDESVAVVLEHGTRRDTLHVEDFAQQVQMVSERNPRGLTRPEDRRELRRALAEGFVLQMLVNATLAASPDLVADTAAVSAQIAQFDAQFGSAAAFDQALAADGLTRDSLRALLGYQLQQQALIERWASEAPSPSAADVAAYRLKMADEVTVRHIVWLYPDNPADLDSVHAAALAVRDSLARGADFATTARRHGQDGTAEQGGLLDPFNRRASMDADFLKAAFAIAQPGQMAPGLVESQFGWHVIRLDKRERGALMPEDEAREAVRAEAGQTALRNRLRSLATAEGVVVRVNPAVVDADLNTPLRR